jgi:hypothetical protein
MVCSAVVPFEVLSAGRPPQRAENSFSSRSTKGPPEIQVYSSASTT